MLNLAQDKKILVPGLVVLVFCCICSSLFVLFPSRPHNSVGTTPGPTIDPGQQAQATPTALFNFGATPFPTLAAPTALPTIPLVPTATPNPTATFTPLPTSTPPPATPTSFTSVTIVELNKAAEYVEIQNTGNGPLDLTGWKLVSERGNQSCTLTGTLQPNETLRIWSRHGASGLSCDFSFNIWNDDQLDPAVLLDPQGQEISRYP